MQITHSKSKAFTLIELLVVIVIIAVLAGIALPVYNSVIEKGKTVKCSSNLRQIGSGMFMFAQEHNGYFPQSGDAISWGGTDGTTGQASWMEQLGPYVGSQPDSTGKQVDPQNLGGKSIFTCPSSSNTASLPGNKYYSYFNGAHAAYSAASGTFAAVKQQLITSPAEHIISGDITTPGFGVNDADKDDYTQNPISVKAPFHSGVINLLFADGHVGIVSWSGTLAAASSDGGYFDKTRMCTVYSGAGTNTTYTSP